MQTLSDIYIPFKSSHNMFMVLLRSKLINSAHPLPRDLGNQFFLVQPKSAFEKSAIPHIFFLWTPSRHRSAKTQPTCFQKCNSSQCSHAIDAASESYTLPKHIRRSLRLFAGTWETKKVVQPKVLSKKTPLLTSVFLWMPSPDTIGKKHPNFNSSQYRPAISMQDRENYNENCFK